MKKSSVIALVCVFALIIAAGVFVYSQWDNVRAVIDAASFSSTKMDGDDIISKIEDIQQTDRDILDKYGVRQLTDDEKKAVANGELSVSDAVSAMVGGSDTTPEIPPVKDGPAKTDAPEISANTQTTQPSASGLDSKPTAKDNQKDVDKYTGEKIAELYVMKASYIGEIESVVQLAKDKYHALPEEKQNAAAITSIVMSHVSDLSSLEKRCDADVEALLSDLSDYLTENGESTEVVEQLRNVYKEEKRLQKAFYINQLS